MAIKSISFLNNFPTCACYPVTITFGIEQSGKEFAMKKLLIAALLFSLCICLGACTNSNAAATPAASASTLSTEGRLLVGTIQLENTDQAVDAAQAATLLPLWETLQSLASSGTAAEAEVQAVVDQINSAMTSEQLSSITAMNLTVQDLLSASHQNESTTSAASASTAGANKAQMPANSSGGAALSGGGPGGNPPSDAGSGPMNVSAGTDTTGMGQAASTTAVNSPSNSASSQVPTALIGQLVELLKKKI
jgi:hypothetical protein